MARLLLAVLLVGLGVALGSVAMYLYLDNRETVSVPNTASRAADTGIEREPLEHDQKSGLKSEPISVDTFDKGAKRDVEASSNDKADVSESYPVDVPVTEPGFYSKQDMEHAALVRPAPKLIGDYIDPDALIYESGASQTQQAAPQPEE